MRYAGALLLAVGLVGCAVPSAQPRMAGTVGIYGVITGFGSVHLDGMAIATGGSVPVLIDGMVRSQAALRPGHVAAVVAESDAGVMQARRIDVWHAVAGPVEARDEARGTLFVAGQRVRLQPSTHGDRDVMPGEWVEVSGLRDRGGTIVASRVDRRAPGTAIISGRLDRVRGAWQIGAIRVIPPREASRDVAGAQVVVAGTYAPGVLTAHSMVVNRGLPFAPGLSHFIVQAYARPEGRGLRLGPNVLAEGLPDPRQVWADRPSVVELRRGRDGGLHTVAFMDARGAESGGSGAAGSTAGAAASAAGGTNAASGGASGAGLGGQAGAAGPGSTGGSTAGGSSGGGHGGGAGGGQGAGAGNAGASGAGGTGGGQAGGGGAGGASGGGGAVGSSGSGGQSGGAGASNGSAGTGAGGGGHGGGSSGNGGGNAGGGHGGNGGNGNGGNGGGGGGNGNGGGGHGGEGGR